MLSQITVMLERENEFHTFQIFWFLDAIKKLDSVSIIYNIVIFIQWKYEGNSTYSMRGMEDVQTR